MRNGSVEFPSAPPLDFASCSSFPLYLRLSFSPLSLLLLSCFERRGTWRKSQWGSVPQNAVLHPALSPLISSLGPFFFYAPPPHALHFCLYCIHSELVSKCVTAAPLQSPWGGHHLERDGPKSSGWNAVVRKHPGLGCCGATAAGKHICTLDGAALALRELYRSPCICSSHISLSCA